MLKSDENIMLLPSDGTQIIIIRITNHSLQYCTSLLHFHNNETKVTVDT